MNLLTGATGFVGGHVVEYLFSQNEISKGTFRRGSHLKIMDLNGVQGIEADIADHHSLHEAAEGCDTVYSMASPTPGDGEDPRRANAEGVASLLEVAQEMGVKTFVHLGTIDCYGFGAGKVGPGSQLRPAGPYQEAKARAEAKLQEYARQSPSPRIAIVRAARAFGPRDATLSAPLLRMLAAGTAVVPKGEPASFTHPKDIAQAMYKAAMSTQAPSGSVYLVKSFDAGPQELASALAASLGVRPKVKQAGLFSRSALPPYTQQQLGGGLRIDEQEGWKALGYSPAYSLAKTCDEVAQWYRKEPWAAEQP